MGEVSKLFDDQKSLDSSAYEFLYKNLPKRARKILIKSSN